MRHTCDRGPAISPTGQTTVRSKSGRNTSIMQFLTIPNEIKLLIAENLRPSDVNSLLKVNRHLNSLVTPILHKFAFEEKDGFPALHWAAAQGYEPLAQLLLDSNRPEIFHDDPQFPGCTPLHWAAECNREAITVLLLEKGVRVDPKDERGLTPLFCAAKYGNAGVMKLLLSYGANVCARNDNEETMLHIAAKNGLETVIRLLLGQGIDINIRAGRQGTALHYAVKHRKESVVRLLIDKGASISAKNGDGDTPVYCAAALDQQAIVRLLLEKEILEAPTDNKGDTALHRAARGWAQMSARIIKPLLEMGADVNAQNHAGETPLICAIKANHIQVACLLLKNGADVALRTADGNTAFACVIEHASNYPFLVLLLDALLDVPTERWVNIDAPRVLHSAAHLQHEAMVNLLLNKGIDMNIRNSIGETPLHRASAEGEPHQVNVSLLLLNRGATVDARDKSGETPLHHAATHAREATVRLLLERGADVGARDSNGVTALHWVAQNSSQHESVLKTAKVLLENGADVNAVNVANQTPLSWALGFGGDVHVITLLRRVAGKIRAQELAEGLGMVRLE